MSDLAGAAAALGIPEALVKRSAEARAKEAGVTVDEILAAWAGGSAPPAPASPSAPQEDQQQETKDQEAETGDQGRETRDEGEGFVEKAGQGPTAEVPATPTPASAPHTTHHPPPVLVGQVERVGGLVAGILGLLVLSLLLAVAAPAVPMEGDGVRTSRRPFTAAALEGRDVYLQQGCASCHTQLVRNIVSDVGLGPVTLSDTNQVIGYRRYGPDLSTVGSRITDPSAFTAILLGGGQHPSVTAISDEELNSLVAYLVESR